ncbi:MAG TPA: hypothetical protein VHJ18_27745, partial [Streptosporangiaceae bacterium]|nr:hypothetical protein [Streptosporangiaceae bacterium]
MTISVRSRGLLVEDIGGLLEGFGRPRRVPPAASHPHRILIRATVATSAVSPGSTQERTGMPSR